MFDIQTEDLFIRQIQENDWGAFHDVQPYVMIEQTVKQVCIWARRWREGDVYSGLTVLNKGAINPIGFVILNPGESPREIGHFTGEQKQQISRAIKAFALAIETHGL